MTQYCPSVFRPLFRHSIQSWSLSWALRTGFVWAGHYFFMISEQALFSISWTNTFLQVGIILYLVLYYLPELKKIFLFPFRDLLLTKPSHSQVTRSSIWTLSQLVVPSSITPWIFRRIQSHFLICVQREKFPVLKCKVPCLLFMTKSS